MGHASVNRHTSSEQTHCETHSAHRFFVQTQQPSQRQLAKNRSQWVGTQLSVRRAIDNTMDGRRGETACGGVGRASKKTLGAGCDNATPTFRACLRSLAFLKTVPLTGPMTSATEAIGRDKWCQRRKDAAPAACQRVPLRRGGCVTGCLG